MESIILFFVNLLQIYLLFGLLFSLIFVWKGLSKVDPAVKGSSFWFKAIIFPGLCAFWPLMLYKWVKHTKIKQS